MSPEYQRTSEGKKMKTNAIVRKLMAPPLMSFVLFFFLAQEVQEDSLGLKGESKGLDVRFKFLFELSWSF
jgi:hypothetical protein